MSEKQFDELSKAQLWDLLEQKSARIIELENIVAKQQARLTDFETGIAHATHVEDAAGHHDGQDWLNPLRQRWTGAEGDK